MPRSPATGPVLSQRALNRTLLHRQRLLERGPYDTAETIDHLVGMQSQVPKAPFVGLWSRIAGFDPATLDTLMLERAAVRASLMRTTLHLVSADDAIGLRPLFQPVLERAFHSQRAFREGVDGIDPDELLAAGREALEATPLSTSELGRALGPRWPDRDPSHLAYAVRFQLPLVQVTPRGTWASTQAPRVATFETWLGRSAATAGDTAALLRRYLAAFGPATPADVASWSGWTGMRAVLDRLRPRLRLVRDEDGRELFDIPDAPYPAADTPAPTRFLPMYDNIALGHENRSRLATRAFTEPIWHRGGILVDGFLRGTWRLDRQPGGDSLMRLRVFEPMTAGEVEGVEEEAARLAAFLNPDDASRCDVERLPS